MASDRNGKRLDEDLGKAFDAAKSETAKLIAEQHNIAAEQAGSSVPTRGDCRVTQVVDIKKGVHCVVAKDPASTRPIPPRPVAQTAEYLVTTARGSDLNKAMDEASWAMIRIGEMTAPEKSVHCVVPKNLWVQR